MQFAASGLVCQSQEGFIEYKHINAITLRIQHKNKLIAAVTKKTI
jgi:hypothetical protein